MRNIILPIVNFASSHAFKIWQQGKRYDDANQHVQEQTLRSAISSPTVYWENPAWCASAPPYFCMLRIIRFATGIVTLWESVITLEALEEYRHLIIDSLISRSAWSMRRLLNCHTRWILTARLSFPPRKNAFNSPLAVSHRLFVRFPNKSYLPFRETPTYEYEGSSFLSRNHGMDGRCHQEPYSGPRIWR